MTSKDSNHELFNDNINELQQCLENLTAEQQQDISKKWPSTLQSLVLLIEQELQKQQLPHSKKAAESIVFALGHYFGGRDIYIPKDDRLKAALRDIEIWQQFTGYNLEPLALKFGLTTRRIAEIIQAQRSAETARKQRQLF